MILMAGSIGPNGKQVCATWIYDNGKDAWTRLVAPAPPDTSSHSGNTLMHDSHYGVFLLKDVTRIRTVWAIRYVPNP